jgi:UDP:flavonoid glycosyltransferase YjiC (YdhE family)
MHVFILTIGTRGDFELFLILARALRNRGHRVVMGTSGFFSEQARAAGMEWVPIGNGSFEEITAVLKSLSSVENSAERTLLFFKRWLQPQLSKSMHQITAVGEGSDYFISNLKMMLQRGDEVVPGAAVTYDPPHALEDLPKYGTQNHRSRILDLVAMNKDLMDPGSIWGERYHFTGFWYKQDQSDWRPSEVLSEFMRSGPPPIVITMGSMVMFDAEKFVRDVGQAVRQCGQRAVIVGGWSGISADEETTDELCFVSEVPYEWLFPRAACIIHHGGVGTVAAALRAGIPSIVFPQIDCQLQFGEILAKEDLVAGIFNTHHCKADEISTAIDRAVNYKTFEFSARSWQKKILADKGVDAAVDLIEAHWKQIHPD